MNKLAVATGKTGETEQTDYEVADTKTIFGFWVYLMTDCVLFASLFAVYAVLHASTYGGPSGQHLFNLHSVLAETLILLTSSFTCGLAVLSAQALQKKRVLFWLAVTMLLGLAFLTLELTEFRHLAAEGNSWRRSGFLSAFFTLVGTHGLHITAGLLWMLVLGLQIVYKGFTKGTLRRLTMLSMFWHFLDLIWIFIFTIVYLMGAIPI
jgi:cytochrome o ubiquinol oxidase subunit 3